MKRAHAVAALWSVCVAVLLAACAGDDSLVSDNETDASDAQTIADVTVTDSGAHTDAASTDSAAHDASVDAVADAGPPGLVTIHAIDNSLGSRSPTTPVVGATVVFFDPDGTPHSALNTDDAGAASEVVLPGSSVTVSMPAPGAPSTRVIVSIVAIEPGDDLKVNTTLPMVGGAAPTGTGALTAPPPSGDGGHGISQWSDGCEVDPLFEDNADMGIGPACVVDGSVNMLASVQDDIADGNPNIMTAFATAQNIPVVDDEAAITDWSWQPATLMQPTLTGTMPIGSTFLNISAELRQSSIIYAWETTGGYPVSDGGTVDVTPLGLPPPGLLDNVVYDLSASNSNSVDAINQLIIVASASDPLNANLGDIPPLLVAATATFDPSTNRATASWTAEGPLSSLSGEWARIGWTGASGHSYTWNVIAAAGTSATTPPLTSDLVGASDFPTTSGAQRLGFDSVWLQFVSTSPSYSAYRASYGRYITNSYPTYDPIQTTPITIRQTMFYP